MLPMILLALAFAAIILVGATMVAVNDLIESSLRHQPAAERPRPRRRRPGRRMLV